MNMSSWNSFTGKKCVNPEYAISLISLPRSEKYRSFYFTKKEEQGFEITRHKWEQEE